MHTSNRCQRGFGNDAAAFTAIELLAASALAALLTVVVLGVVGSLSRHRRELVAADGLQPWHVHFIDRLTWDFANARRYQATARQLDLTGAGARDFTTGLPTHRPATVSYIVRQQRENYWLFRREAHLDDRALDNYRQELVCGGVRTLEIQPLYAAAGGNQPAGAVPPRFRVRLNGNDPDQPILEHIICIP